MFYLDGHKITNKSTVWLIASCWGAAWPTHIQLGTAKDCNKHGQDTYYDVDKIFLSEEDAKAECDRQINQGDHSLEKLGDALKAVMGL